MGRFRDKRGVASLAVGESGSASEDIRTKMGVYHGINGSEGCR